MRSLVGNRYVLPTVYVVDQETRNDFIPAAEELMMVNRLLIVPGVEHAMLNIGFNLGH